MPHTPCCGRPSCTQFILKAFEVRSAKVMREWASEVRKFAIGASAGPNGVLKWPVFKWAGGQVRRWRRR